MSTRQQKPPDPLASHTGHPLPRRATAGNSVTLKHHKLARDASSRASTGSGQAQKHNVNRDDTTSSPRRNSSGESQDTGNSDPRKWFDQSNQNPTATFDNSTMDVDPPFFQKESDSSNESKEYPYMQSAGPPRLLTTQSSSAGDYRSVIDDLTVEIQKLKDELKRYKQQGPDMLRKEKLFEIKIHGLPKRKKRELESTLRDFAASLDGSPHASSSKHKNVHSNRDHMYSGSGASKHASSSSGSNARPNDSAYASMSTGAHSSGTSLRNPGSSRTKSSDQKVENYLRDIPEGLYPRHMVMTEKDKKKLVVRRLEQLFTGKMGGRPSKSTGGALVPVVADQQLTSHPKSSHQPRLLVHQPPSLLTAPGSAQLSREARMLPQEQHTIEVRKSSHSRDNGSASNSNGDQTDSTGNGVAIGAAITSPARPPPPEQRATQPKDLDPDRIQIPSENMDYIKHLGLLPPELLTMETGKDDGPVRPDAEGWVYLNLLCNLAQLHIINVTPSFVREAVSEMSTKFQLSSDGRKIRWRGGTDGTKFAGDSSGDVSETSPQTDETESSSKEASRKRQKTGPSVGDEVQSGGSSKDTSKFGPQVTASTESFQYKPLFVHQVSPNGQTSMDETVSSFGPLEDSRVGESGWGSGTSHRKKRRHDGAIIYYSGAPFCTDLLGDAGDSSPTTYMLSSGLAQQDEEDFARPPPRRSASGSSLPYRPLSDGIHDLTSKTDMADLRDVPGLTADVDTDTDDMEFDTEWSKHQQYINVHPLEPCGLGGVLPDDHFMVVVTTRRPIQASGAGLTPPTKSNEATTDGIIGRLATMSTSSPLHQITESSVRHTSPGVEIEYISGRIKRLAPVALPPPAIFVPPFSTDGSSSDEDDMSSDASSTSEGLNSRKADLHLSDGYPDGVDLTSGDEDGEDPDDESGMEDYSDKQMDHESHSPGKSSAEAAAGTTRGRSKSASADLMLRVDA